MRLHPYGLWPLVRHVIVTVPLGVLKKGSITFSPPLPAAKQAAIAALGMGLLDKVALVFRIDDIFWDKSVEVRSSFHVYQALPSHA